MLLEHPPELAETLLPGWDGGIKLAGVFQVPSCLVVLVELPVSKCTAVESGGVVGQKT